MSPICEAYVCEPACPRHLNPTTPNNQSHPHCRHDYRPRGRCSNLNRLNRAAHTLPCRRLHRTSWS